MTSDLSSLVGDRVIYEAEWHIAAIECRIMLEMRKRVSGDQIDDAAMVRMFEQLEAAIDQLRELKDATAAKRSDTSVPRP